MRFEIESNGGVSSRSNLAGHSVIFDQPATFGGADSGPSPLDVMVAAVGACSHYYAAAFLHGRGHSTDGIRVVATAEKAAEGRKRLGMVNIEIFLPPGLPEEWLPRIERAVQGCPALGTLVQAPVVTVTVAPEPPG